MRNEDPGRVGLRDIPQIVAAHQDAYRRLQLMAEPDLSYLFWECTLRCNLRCTHCGSSCEATSPLEELTTAEVMGVLDTVHEDFDTTRMVVAITGGEPLLRPDLYEVLRRMNRFGMTTGIVTNGTVLTRERARKLVDAGLGTTSISLDGPEEPHDLVRGHGSFVKTVAGMRTAAEVGVPVVEAITCVRAANVHRLAEVEQLVRENGASSWRLITIDRMGRGGNPELWLDPPQVREMLDFIEDRRRSLARAGDPFDIRYSCGGFLGVRREFTVRPGDGQCFAGLCIASILCDGQVSACPSLPRSWAQGSVREKRLSTIWNERFEQFRDRGWGRTGVCERCIWWGVCLGGGLHERLAQPDEFCWIERQRD